MKVIRDLKALYVAMKGNKVVCFGTSLSNFLENFQELEPDIYNYQSLRRRFKKSDCITFTNKKLETYILQRVFDN
jgi:hypothetical protein